MNYFKDKKIDTSNWKYFNLIDFFLFEKGSESSPNISDYISDEGINCVVAKKNNSGFGGRKTKPKRKWNGEGLALIAQGDGGAGMCFYVNGEFCANTSVWILLPKDKTKFNKNIGLFLSTITSSYKLVFSRSRSINLKNLKKLFIKLPTKDNIEPDWEYMNNYINEILKFKLINFINNFSKITIKNIDITSWKSFRIGDLFERVKIKSISNVFRNFPIGNINVIGNSSINNGVIKKLDINDWKYLHPEGVLSYGAKGGLFFYQEEVWASTDHVHMLKFKGNLSKDLALFLCTILNKLILNKGGWTSGLESNILDEHISLPTINGKIDVNYMENFIKKIKLENFN